MNKLYLLDLSGLIFRAYYALPVMKNHEGAPVQALFGFLRMLTKFLREHSVEYIAVLADGPRHIARRKAIFADYKAKREKTPEDLPQQITWAKECCHLLGVPLLSIEEAEADDLAASVTQWAVKVPMEVVLCTSDKDWCQLIGPHVKVLKEDQWMDQEAVVATFGVAPSQLVDALAIIGDASDHIPGVPGFGPKKTAQFLQQFGSLEAFFQNPTPRFDPILKEKERLLKNKQLITLDASFAIPQEIQFYRKQPADETALVTFFERMNFKSLLPKKDPKAIETPIELATTPFFPIQGETLGVLLKTDTLSIARGKEVWQFPWPTSLNLKECQVVTHDANALYGAFLRENLPLFHLKTDLAIAHYLLEPEGEAKKRMPPIQMLIEEAEKAEKALVACNLLEWCKEVEQPLSLLLARIQQRGIFVQAHILKSLQQKISVELAALQEKILAYSPTPLNIKSPKQLALLLFETLQLPVTKKTATGQYSTDNESLEELKKSHPIAELLLEYRALDKLRSTYVDALLTQLQEKDGRIHCTFEQCVTATGRLSCQNPNLQNVPPLIRAAFVPEEKNWSFLSADYAQMELRLLAHFSQDETMLSAFRANEDIHRFTAALIFNCTQEAVTLEQRAIAKTVNFGISYGQTPFGLAKVLQCSPADAKKFIDAYFERYPKVFLYLEECKRRAAETGFASTLTGRRRPIPEIHSKNRILRTAAERLAINTPLQGFGADLIKKAMLSIDAALQPLQLPCYLLLQIHDELLFEGPTEVLQTVAPLIKEKMESVWELSIPLAVEIHIGKNWQEC